MSVYVTITYTSEADRWFYRYITRFDMLILERKSMITSLFTLQGAYNLITKIDMTNTLSYFETVGSAEITYWKVLSGLRVPTVEQGRLVLKQDIDDGQRQSYFVDPEYKTFYTQLGEPIEPSKLRHIAIGEQVIADVAADGMLAGIWMLDLPTEIGHKFAIKR